jgi:hypothetical protein
MQALEELPRWKDTIQPCAKNEGYAVYRLYDTASWSRDWNKDKEEYKSDPVDAYSVASDFASVYTTGLLGTDKGHKPGIMIISGDEPTPDELKQVRETQRDYFEHLFHDAIQLNASGRGIGISELHRIACTWLGRLDLPFIEKIEQRNAKECVACGETIAAKANKCRFCGTELDVWYEERALMPDKKDDPFVYDVIERKRAAKAERRVAGQFQRKAVAPEVQAVQTQEQIPVGV